MFPFIPVLSSTRELAPVLSGTHLLTFERWKTDLAKQREEIGGSEWYTSTKNQTRVVWMVAQRFTHATCLKCMDINGELITKWENQLLLK